MAPLLIIRGLAAPIRFLLRHAGVQFEEKVYKRDPPPSSYWKELLDNKLNLDADFPNLPCYIDSDIKLTQSQVILRYIARKHNLAGQNEMEKLRADLLATQVHDYDLDFARNISHNPDYLAKTNEYLSNIVDRLKALSDFLGDAKFVVGDAVTYADFVLYEFLETQVHFKPDILGDFPRLKRYVERISALDAVNGYFSSPGSIGDPFYAASSSVTGSHPGISPAYEGKSVCN